MSDGASLGAGRFRPRARMVKIIGDHLIRDNTVGLMELVKNGYDADADLVTVELHDIDAPEATKIIVRDTGQGMSEATIRGPWMEPAEGSKERSKASSRRTRSGRLPLGEKGVGRFAAQKLGRLLTLVTRPQGEEHEYEVTVDWDRFEADDLYLDQVEIPIARRAPRVFLGRSHGTELTMTSARHAWRRADLERLHASLVRLLSPRKEVKGFKVRLICPEYREFEVLEHTEILEKYQYRIDCAIDATGSAEVEFRERSPKAEVKIDSGTVSLWSLVEPDAWNKRAPACGPVYVQLSAWLLDAKSLADFGLGRDQLKMLAGVSVYRDGFRVLPYGDEGNDWLGLDPRRINVPGQRFGNRQVVGMVEIDQEQNPRLVDKTNREGLQENLAYDDLRLLVLGVVDQLEQRSLAPRQSVRVHGPTKKDLVNELGALKSQLRELKDATAAADARTVAAPDGVNLVQVPREQLVELSERAEFVCQALDMELDAEMSRRETMLHLVGIGLAAERFSHEFDRLVHRVMACCANLRGGLEVDGRSLAELEMATNALRNEVALMGALQYVRRAENKRNVSVKETLELVLRGYDHELDKAGVDVVRKPYGDFSVEVQPASLAQVMDNIVHNAVYWLKQSYSPERKRLTLSIIPDGHEIRISNSGPGLAPHVQGRICKAPFVTAKPNGRGLGLYVSAEILRAIDARIEAMDRTLLPAGDNVGFRVLFESPEST